MLPSEAQLLAAKMPMRLGLIRRPAGVYDLFEDDPDLGLANLARAAHAIATVVPCRKNKIVGRLCDGAGKASLAPSLETHRAVSALLRSECLA